MTRPRLRLAMLALATLAACGQGGKSSTSTPAVNAVSLQSTDFALIPCPASTPESPCVFIGAGGKRVLAGAPAGLRQALEADPYTAANLDAVLLFSLQAGDIEGLDEVRNATWVAGRENVLPVAGPSGTRDMLGALNKVYELSDAERFVSAPPKGGFDAALLGLLPGEGDAKTRVFDTGDLVITKIETALGQAGYWVDYGGKRAVLQPCGMDQAVRFSEASDFVLACDETGWPLSKLHYLLQSKKAD
ncbi:MAG: hypothetical protein R3C13_08835 [Hyphomonas sp.]|uniref:hypothetical protein n=1 Tax=Hyphomonas sp. TaxID=87 RepID=UPI00352730E6